MELKEIPFRPKIWDLVAYNCERLNNVEVVEQNIA